MDHFPVVIIGAGHAGVALAASLKRIDPALGIAVINGEDDLPYQRPPLSKAYLNGTTTAAQLALAPDSLFAEGGVALLSGLAADIDRRTRTVRLTDGRSIGYDRLVLASGARNRIPEIPGIEAPGLLGKHVLGLRSKKDADRLKSALPHLRHVTVVGAGFIGLEFAAVATCTWGITVEVIELGPRIMARAVSPEMSSFFETAHQARGTSIHCREAITSVALQPGGKLRLDYRSGRRIETDMLLYGIGAIPNDGLAVSAGLEVDRGVLVDDRLTTSDPAIFAIGDIAIQRSTDGAPSVRLESIQNATDQARYLARHLTEGASPPYHALPWFWSDQGNLKLQIAGQSGPEDQRISRQDSERLSLSVHHFREGRLVCVETVNRGGEHLAAKRLLGQAANITPEMIRAAGFDLKQIARDLPSLSPEYV